MSDAEVKKSDAVKLNGLFAIKEGMASVFDEEGKMIPVTILKVPAWVVSQVKTVEKDGYVAVQIATTPKKSKNAAKSEVSHLKKAGFETGAKIVREIRMESVEGIEVGAKVSLDSLAKGDLVKLSGTSKGRGFSGVIRRWNFSGGPGSHGSGFHRRPGSIGNRTWPGRVMPGKKFPGQYGNETSSVPRAKIVSVIPEENVIVVKGAIPGARNGIVSLVKI